MRRAVGTRGLLFIGALGLLACEVEHSEQAEHARADPAPSDQPLADEDCQACHDEVAAQWAASRHHSAFQNPDFARAYAREPRDFCRDCHAPGRVRAGGLAVPEAEAEALGVGCVDCHVDAGAPTVVRTGPHSSQAEGAAPPHGLVRDLSFATDSCARCHEFAFPAVSRRPEGTMMQLTMREHRDSAFADRSCASCHMPGRDHGFGSTRDPAAMRAAVEVEARWVEGAGELVVELTPVGVGHAFPTGDLYRRLAIGVELRAVDGAVRGSARRYLARQFAPWRLADGKLNPAWHEEVVDERLVGPTEVSVALAFDPLDAEPRLRAGELLVWWVDYERVDARDDLEPGRSTIADAVRLARGERRGPG